ncbi:MAG TPA: hypothetical protein VHB70_07025 [Parafilimonas sp.]|nr:hypothetical protein [Parafilimonas sp.]
MQKILDWSEVWTVLIPIIIYVIKTPQAKYLKPIILYLLIAFVLNFIGDIIEENFYHDPQWVVKINYNQPFYNIHSISRLILLIYFFRKINIPVNKILRTFIPVFVVLILVINFSFFHSFKNFSSLTFSVEGITLIVLCVLYFFRRLQSDQTSTAFDSSMYIVTGLAIYEAVCFPIFLFYNTLIKQTEHFAINIWDVHNIAYIVFCLFIARAFYGTSQRAV